MISATFQIVMLGQPPVAVDDSKVKKAFAIYEAFLTDNQYLAGDHLTLAGN